MDYILALLQRNWEREDKWEGSSLVVYFMLLSTFIFEREDKWELFGSILYAIINVYFASQCTL